MRSIRPLAALVALSVFVPLIYVDADTGIRMGGSDPRRGGAAVGQKDDPE